MAKRPRARARPSRKRASGSRRIEVRADPRHGAPAGGARLRPPPQTPPVRPASPSMRELEGAGVRFPEISTRSTIGGCRAHLAWPGTRVPRCCRRAAAGWEREVKEPPRGPVTTHTTQLPIMSMSRSSCAAALTQRAGSRRRRLRRRHRFPFRKPRRSLAGCRGGRGDISKGVVQPARARGAPGAGRARARGAASPHLRHRHLKTVNLVSGSKARMSSTRQRRRPSTRTRSGSRWSGQVLSRGPRPRATRSRARRLPSQNLPWRVPMGHRRAGVRPQRRGL